VYVLFDFLPRDGPVIVYTQERSIEDVSPIFFTFLAYTAGEITTVENLVTGTGTGAPVVMAKLDDVYLAIVR
jgi:hypothetical protein